MLTENSTNFFLLTCPFTNCTRTKRRRAFTNAARILFSELSTFQKSRKGMRGHVWCCAHSTAVKVFEGWQKCCHFNAAHCRLKRNAWFARCVSLPRCSQTVTTLQGAANVLSTVRMKLAGTATGIGLEGPGIESRCGEIFPHPSTPTAGPTQPTVQWVPVVSRR